jgi:hypothetical protein
MPDYDKRPKDKWDKWDVVLKPTGALLTAVTIATLGFVSSSYLNHRQNIETRARLLTEIVSQREQSESSLRKDMFNSIIETFLRSSAQPPSLKEKVLNLELLAYNFHESLNLQPLFQDIRREIEAFDASGKDAYLHRLERVGREITMKQRGVLEAAGAKQDYAVDLTDLAQTRKPVRLDDVSLNLGGSRRNFSLMCLDFNPSSREIKMRLMITGGSEGGEDEETTREFWLGFFDFPMIDNTRLSNDQRCAVVLNSLEQTPGDVFAEITLLYFPGSHASLRERPYFEDLIKGLLGFDREGEKTQ